MVTMRAQHSLTVQPLLHQNEREGLANEPTGYIRLSLWNASDIIERDVHNHKIHVFAACANSILHPTRLDRAENGYRF